MDATRTLQLPDYFMIAGYFVLMLGIGMYFYRSMRDIKDYFNGGNNIPWWLSGVSFYMSSFSAAAFVIYPSLCYRHGWVGITLLWVAVPATLFSALFLAKKWRRARIESPMEYVELRFSALLRQVFAWQGLPIKIIDDGIKLFAIGTFISVSLGFDMTLSMLGAGIVILAYTFMGGLWAVAITDFVQFVVLTAAIIIILPLSFLKAGGVYAVFSTLPEGYLSLTSSEHTWQYVIYVILLYTLAWSSVNWSLIQRYYCVPREKDAVRVGLLVIVLYIIGPPLMFLPAFAAIRLLPNLADAGNVYAELCRLLLPAGMVGLVISAMFAATMSMLSSDYNVCANVVTHDIYRRLLRPNATSRELVIVGRMSTGLVGLAALVAAILMARGQGENLFRTMVTLFSVATAPVAIPMILGLLSPKYTARSALYGFLLGLLVGLGFFALSRYPYPFTTFGIQWIPESKVIKVLGYPMKPEMAIFINSLLVTSVVMVISTIIHPLKTNETGQVRKFFERLNTPIGLLPEDRREALDKSAISPFRVVGLSLVVIAFLLLLIVWWSESFMTAVMNIGISAFLFVTGILMVWTKKSERKIEENP